MKTVRLTMAQALVRHLCAQHMEIEGGDVPLFPGVFAIFGHGNVTCLAEALAASRDRLPVWRGQNEQSMALAAIAFAKSRLRRQIMICASSIGPGSTNMVTAAAVAHTNRLPVLLLGGDVFGHRLPDPVLQQVEHFTSPGTSVNDAFRAVTRYWDRISAPAQILQSLPQAVAAMLDPAECGPAFLGLCQDTQGEAFDYPVEFFAPTLHRIPRRRADRAELAAAARILGSAQRPLIVAGGGVHYAQATEALSRFAARFGIPVVETIAGRGALVHDDPCNAGPVGVSGSASANAVAAEADVVVAVGTRLQDFTTGSWSVFQNPELRLIAINTARYDAVKHRASPVVGDALETIEELELLLAGWRAPAAWSEQARTLYAQWNETVDRVTAPPADGAPSYAQVIGAVNRTAGPRDRVITAAGGLPAELTRVWRVKAPGTFDCEFGYSCMGYEIAGGWGARMAQTDGEVIVLVGDGSYLMMNSDIYSTVLTGHKMIVVVCDNGGYAVIDRLQGESGMDGYNNMIATSRVAHAARVDFAAHARSMGAAAEDAADIAGLEAALIRARAADRTTVIVVHTDAVAWTPGGAWWELGMPEVSEHPRVRDAAAMQAAGRRARRLGV